MRKLSFLSVFLWLSVQSICQMVLPASLDSSTYNTRFQNDTSRANVYSQLSNKQSAPQFISLTSTYTLTSQTALQKLFNSTANGAFNAASSTMYYFECEFDLSSMSTTSGNFTFGFLGTATFTSLRYTSIASKTAIGTPSTAQISTFLVATASPLVSANTTATGQARITGILRVNAGGTIIPAVGLGIAAAAVVGINSRFVITQIGTNTQTSSNNFN